MRLIRPTVITDAMLVSSNVPENDYAAYAAGTTYALGDRVIVAADHRIYESLQASNTGHTPASSPTWWLDVSATNRWKMFDTIVGSQTAQANSLTITIAPGIIDSIALLDLAATEIVITMTDPVEGVVYSETIDLIMASYISNAWEYFFEPIITTDATVLMGLPAYGSAEIAVTINNPSGTAKIGTLIFGAAKNLGETRYDPKIGITDYSRKTTDDFGNTSITQRAYTKRMSCNLAVDNSAVDALQRTLAEYRATPVCWVGADLAFSSMIIYGFYKNFEITIPGPTVSDCSLEVEGLA
jgi:hypothetical protein